MDGELNYTHGEASARMPSTPTTLPADRAVLHDVLLVSAGLVHPPYRGRMQLKETLAAIPRVRLNEVTSLAEAAKLPLSDYRAMVLYYHHRDDVLADADLQAFRSFVSGGGGVLAVHSATASYKPSAAYFEILGGRFVGHGPVESMQVEVSAADDPIFGGIGGFEIKDELYLHELQPDLRVHFHAVHNGKAEPMVWTREVGAGRVCYVCPGHRSASMQHPAVQEIVRRGLTWVSRRGSDAATATRAE